MKKLFTYLLLIVSISIPIFSCGDGDERNEASVTTYSTSDLAGQWWFYSFHVATEANGWEGCDRSLVLIDTNGNYSITFAENSEGPLPIGGNGVYELNSDGIFTNPSEGYSKGFMASDKKSIVIVSSTISGDQAIFSFALKVDPTANYSASDLDGTWYSADLFRSGVTGFWGDTMRNYSIADDGTVSFDFVPELNFKGFMSSDKQTVVGVYGNVFIIFNKTDDTLNYSKEDIAGTWWFHEVSVATDIDGWEGWRRRLVDINQNGNLSFSNEIDSDGVQSSGLGTFSIYTIGTGNLGVEGENLFFLKPNKNMIIYIGGGPTYKEEWYGIALRKK